VSEETYQNLADALAAHVADEYAEYPLLTDWVAMAACVGPESGETGYVHVLYESPPHSLEGLIDRAKRRLCDDTPDVP
jgi:hypothetical protein